MSSKDLADAKVPSRYEHTCLPLTVRHTGRRGAAAAGRGGGGLGAATAGRGGGCLTAAGGGERGGGEVFIACGGGFATPVVGGGVRRVGVLGGGVLVTLAPAGGPFVRSS